MPHKKLSNVAGCTLALVVAIAALIVAIVGIRDVRHQVRLLLTMERNRTFTKVLEKFTRVFVDFPDEDVQLEITQLKHEYVLLARAIDKNAPLESAMHEVNHETLLSAVDLVKRGYARWKIGTDPERAAEVVKNWQTEKISPAVACRSPAIRLLCAPLLT